MSGKKKETTVVVSQTEIATDIYDMWIATDLSLQAKPGQFISVYTQDKSTLLPRPISICEVDRENRRIRIVYRVAGKGTAKSKKAFLMGGGIGIPPMLELAKELDCEKDIIAGYRNSELFLADELKQYGNLYVATEDGSEGTKGNVMNAIAENNLKADVIFACGPMPMLRAIKKYAQEQNIPAYISLEERMACGVGACLGCVVKTKNVDAHSHVKNARICTDGPVYLASEVDI